VALEDPKTNANRFRKASWDLSHTLQQKCAYLLFLEAFAAIFICISKSTHLIAVLARIFYSLNNKSEFFSIRQNCEIHDLFLFNLG